WDDEKKKDPQSAHVARHEIDVWPALEWSLKGTAWLIWFWLAVARLIILAFAVSYFFSSMTTIYFLLRKDVEGDDYTEINLEEEEDDEDAFEPHDLEKKPGPPGTEGKPLPLVAGGPTPEKKDDHKH